MDSEPVIEGHPTFRHERWSAAWCAPPFEAPAPIRAEAFCVTDDGLVVLVSPDEVSWTLPGGRLEPGESAEQAVIREIREEACAEVEQLEYLGCWRVTDHDAEPPSVEHEATFWARVRPQPFVPAFEIAARREVAPSEFSAVVDSPADLRHLVEQFVADAMAVERRQSADDH